MSSNNYAVMIYPSLKDFESLLPEKLSTDNAQDLANHYEELIKGKEVDTVPYAEARLEFAELLVEAKREATGNPATGEKTLLAFTSYLKGIQQRNLTPPNAASKAITERGQSLGGNVTQGNFGGRASSTDGLQGNSSNRNVHDFSKRLDAKIEEELVAEHASKLAGMDDWERSMQEPLDLNSKGKAKSKRPSRPASRPALDKAVSTDKLTGMVRDEMRRHIEISRENVKANAEAIKAMKERQLQGVEPMSQVKSGAALVAKVIMYGSFAYLGTMILINFFK